MVEKICGKGEFWDLLLYQILSPYRSNCLDAGRESQIILGTLGPASLGLGSGRTPRNMLLSHIREGHCCENPTGLVETVGWI